MKQQIAQRMLFLWMLVPLALARSASSTVTSPPPLASAVWGRRRTTTTLLDATKWGPLLLRQRGGAESSATTPQERELTLEEKVHAAMTKLGLKPPPLPSEEANGDDEPIDLSGDAPAQADEAEKNDICSDGVCAMPGALATDATGTEDDNNPESTTTETTTTTTTTQEDPQAIADRIAQTMKVDKSMAWAALGATSMAVHNTSNAQEKQRIYNEPAARHMISLELEMIAQIREDSEEVRQLVDEGWDRFLARRALAFAERNVADARAILMADQADEEAEEKQAAARDQQQQQQQQQHPDVTSFQTVQVDSDFDPTQISTAPSDSNTAAAAASATGPLKPALKESVVFEATTAQLQQLVLESPVPVLLDIYADWCGPCKALSPILEDIAMKSGGALRLVKVNSDNERVVATTLSVTALPTIFGIRNGRIVHMFQGMPKSETMLRNFLMGLLIPGSTTFDPPVTAAQQVQYADWSTQLAKVAGSAAFPFVARERLQDRIHSLLDDLVEQCDGGMDTAEQAVKTIRALLSNVIRDPYNEKFRTVHLDNKVLAAKVAPYPAAVGLLIVSGFQHHIDNDKSLLSVDGKGQKMMNVAPLSVARDALDKWIERTRYEVAKAARQRRDEQDRVQVAQELAAQAVAAQERARREQEAADAAKAQVDPDLCQLKLRLDGKKKIHDVSLHADSALSAVLEKIPDLSLSTADEEEEVQITCVAKRLTVSSTDAAAMQKSLRDHGLLPAATLVLKIKTPLSNDSSGTTTTSISQRAAAKKKKRGSHTMQSVGIYGKDDNAKGELIDGGGGTLYEHDVTDDEADEEKEVAAATDIVEDGDPEEMEQSSATSEVEDDASIQDNDEG